MTTLNDDLCRIFIRDLEGFGRELALFPMEAAVWQTLPGTTNSAGNLTLHVCGGLQHFLGAVLGKSGYLRDRDAEFSRREVPRAELQAQIAHTIKVVRKVLAGLGPEVWDSDYPIQLNGVTLTTRRFLIHLATHVAFHLGQAGYLRRMLTGDNTSSAPVAIVGLQD
jgi:uncharacterized damage-inducible protein DinB